MKDDDRRFPSLQHRLPAPTSSYLGVVPSVAKKHSMGLPVSRSAPPSRFNHLVQPGLPAARGARLRFRLREGCTVLRSRCLAMCQAFCTHSVSPATLHWLRRHPGGSPTACCRSSALQRLLHAAIQAAQGEQDRMEQRAYAMPGRNGALNAFGIKTLERRRGLCRRASPLRQQTTRAAVARRLGNQGHRAAHQALTVQPMSHLPRDHA
jgi:hypothetical protein